VKVGDLVEVSMFDGSRPRGKVVRIFDATPVGITVECQDGASICTSAAMLTKFGQAYEPWPLQAAEPGVVWTGVLKPTFDVPSMAHANRAPEGVSLERHATELLLSVADKTVGVDQDTPRRFLKAMRELTEGHRHEGSLADLLKTFPIEGDPGIITVRGVPFAALCEHHALPFSGHVDVAYLPKDRIVGLSKIPRLVRVLSRRFAVQERIGEDVADAIMTHVRADGVLVKITGRHSCMVLRGVESPGEMVTSCARGVFRTDPAARAEALSLIG